MYALVFDRFGGPEVLRWAEVPAPAPAPAQALVRLSSVGLNLADVYRRKGNYHLAGAPPWILGYEGAGVVERAADEEGGFPVGTRVGFADSPFSNAESAPAASVSS
jgi:NADPH2:quinone reductase